MLATAVLAVTVISPALRAQTNLSEAIRFHRAAAEDHPEDAKILNDLGNLLVLAEAYDEAADSYRQALTLAPESVPVLYNFGLLYQQTENPAKARRTFRRVLEISPEHAWSHYQLGVLLASQDKRAAAIRRFAVALRLQPRLTDPAYNPHILDNTLAADATLRAYANLSPAALAPRLYEHPRQVADLLIPLPERDAQTDESYDATAEDSPAMVPTPVPPMPLQSPATEGLPTMLPDEDRHDAAEAAPHTDQETETPEQPRKRRRPRRNKPRANSAGG